MQAFREPGRSAFLMYWSMITACSVLTHSHRPPHIRIFAEHSHRCMLMCGMP